MLLIDEHKLEQKCNNFGYLPTQFWLKGNDNSIHYKHTYEGMRKKAWILLASAAVDALMSSEYGDVPCTKQVCSTMFGTG